MPREARPRRLTVLAIVGEAPMAVFYVLRVLRSVQRRRPRIAAGSALVVAGAGARRRACLQGWHQGEIAAEQGRGALRIEFASHGTLPQEKR